MSLNGAITNLASWAGNTMMPTMAGMFFASRLAESMVTHAHGI